MGVRSLGGAQQQLLLSNNSYSTTTTTTTKQLKHTNKKLAKFPSRQAPIAKNLNGFLIMIKIIEIFALMIISVIIIPFVHICNLPPNSHGVVLRAPQSAPVTYCSEKSKTKLKTQKTK